MKSLILVYDILAVVDGEEEEAEAEEEEVEVEGGSLFVTLS